MRQYTLNLFVALTGAYGLSVTGFLLLRWLVGENWTVVALFNSFVHLLTIPALFLMPLALLLRRRLLIAVLLPAVLVFVFSYGVMFVTRPAAHAADDDLRLMTYNLLAQTMRLDPALAIIREADADIVALQEVSTDMAARLEADLGDVYPYIASHTQPGDGIVGQAVLSRYPVLDDEFWRVYLSAQRVTVDVRGQVVTLYNVHPMMPMQPGGFRMRAEDIRDILDRAKSETGPLLLAGDFNMSDQSEDYQRVALAYQDAYRAAGWGMGFTFPANLPLLGSGVARPLVRLDYVFHNDNFEAMTAHVLPDSGGSDHLPVVVTLAFSEGGSYES